MCVRSSFETANQLWVERVLMDIADVWHDNIVLFVALE